MSTQSSKEILKQNIFKNYLAKKRTAAPVNSTKCQKSDTPKEDTLTRMAIEEIYREAARGAVRAEKAGPSGWLPCPLRKTNKRFLKNTIKSVITHNNRQNRPASEKPKQKTERELDIIIAGGQRRKPKFGERKHCFRKIDKTKK